MNDFSRDACCLEHLLRFYIKIQGESSKPWRRGNKMTACKSVAVKVSIRVSNLEHFYKSFYRFSISTVAARGWSIFAATCQKHGIVDV